MKKLLVLSFVIVALVVVGRETVWGFGAAGLDTFGLGEIGGMFDTYASPIIAPFAVPINIDVSGFTIVLPPGSTLPPLPPPPAPPSSCPTDKLCIYPNSLAFPDTPADGSGGAKSAMSVTLSNPAGAPTYVISDSLGGSASPFSVDPSSYASAAITPEGRTIAPGQTITLITYFDPTSAGTFNNTLNVSYIAYGNPAGLTDADKDGLEHVVSGVRYIYGDMGAGVMWYRVECCVENGGSSFGASAEYYMPVGSLGSTETFAVTLSGTGIASVPPPTDPICPTTPVWTVQGYAAYTCIDPSEPNFSSTVGAACAPEGSQSFELGSYEPEYMGCGGSSVTNTPASGMYYICAVPTCTATPASFSVNPLVLNFPDTIVDGVGNAVAGPLMVRVQNDGGTAGSVILGTTLPSEYTISGLPGVVSIPANSFIDVPVIFDPQTIGSRPGNLNIIPSVGAPVVVQLNGKGIAAPAVLRVREAGSGAETLSGTLTLPPITVAYGGTASLPLQAINAGPAGSETLNYRVTTAGATGAACVGQCTATGIGPLPSMGTLTWNISETLYPGRPSSLSMTIDQLAADNTTVIKTITVTAPLTWGRAACANGGDDDGDTKIDLGDPGCVDGNDNDETDSPSDGGGGGTDCTPTTINGCLLSSVPVGSTAGTCGSNPGTCTYTCSAGNTWTPSQPNTCVVPPAVTPPTLRSNLPNVTAGNKVRLTWDSNNGDESTCTITGPGITGNPLVPKQGNPEEGDLDVVINGRVTFTLTCPNTPPVTRQVGIVASEFPQ